MIQVYSAICGGKDKPRNDGILCFSAYDRFKDPRLNAKIYKVLSHHFVDAEYSIWIDGNVRLLVKPELLVEMMGASSDCAVFRHCERHNIFQEADFVIEKGKDDARIVREQISAYKKIKFDAQNLGMCFLIIRRHTSEIKKRNERWWSDICRYSVRDQISFPVAFEGAVRYLPAEPIFGGRYFTRSRHEI